jgi:hypothetical protein
MIGRDERGWRVSSRCAADKPQCVEVNPGTRVTLVRDTKGPDTGILTVPAGNWSQFVNHVTR